MYAIILRALPAKSKCARREYDPEARAYYRASVPDVMYRTREEADGVMLAIPADLREHFHVCETMAL